MPVVNVDWDDAQHYAAWLSRITGKAYRLLTEAEYEYATRAGTTTAFYWGDDVHLNGAAMALCDGCGEDQVLNQQPAPVGSFSPNGFGSYDMTGNAVEWTQDCYHLNYQGAPTDGSAWTNGDCSKRIARSGGFFEPPVTLRSAHRGWAGPDLRSNYVGFRVARTLLVPCIPSCGLPTAFDATRFLFVPGYSGRLVSTPGRNPTGYICAMSSLADLPRQMKPAEERRRIRRAHARSLWPPSRPVLAAVCLLGVALLGAIGVWPAQSQTSGPFSLPQPGAASPQGAKAPLSAAQERALKPGSTFAECDKCPLMVVVPAGSFSMGSPISERGHMKDEEPQHSVTIAGQFAVGRYELTFDQWDACVADGGCAGYRPTDKGWGRGSRPVIDVSWNDIPSYVDWLAKKTGQPYRLLSEAEYEYATRAGTTTAYPWGNAIGTNNANCDGCGSQWDNRQTAPVGSFAPNGFGLYDMVGNIYEWVEDCYHSSYDGAPRDGSAWTTGDCVPGAEFQASGRVLRGATWGNPAEVLRSADRYGAIENMRDSGVGLRVARALLAP